MKRNYILALLCLLFINEIINGQTGCKINLTLSKQSQVDSFPVKYGKCKIIEGDVGILGFQVLNLDSLYSLEGIEGGLRIRVTSRLKSLEGLQNLKYVNGDVLIERADSLSSVDQLLLIESCRNLSILSNKNLSSIIVNGLKKCKGDLTIRGNSSLWQIIGGRQLQNVKNISITDNRKLHFIDGFEEVKSLENLEISMNESLQEIHILNSAMVADNIFIRSNDSLKILKACNSVLKAKDVEIIENGILSQLFLLDSVKTLSSINIADNSLDSLVGFNNLDTVYGEMLRIYTEKKLDTIKAFRRLTYINGKLDISQLYSLRSLNNFSELNHIGGALSILDCTSLINLAGLENVKDTVSNIQIGGNYLINGFASLNKIKHVKESIILTLGESQTIDGLKELQRVGTEINISAGSKLKKLDAFYKLDTIHSLNFDSIVYRWSLGISAQALINLNELKNLRYTKGIILSGNRKLVDISGLDNVDTSILYDLQFLHNDSLRICNSKMVCDYLSNETKLNYFYKNAPGCNTREEILASCTTGTDERHTTITANGVYPNPCPLNTTLWFEGWDADFDLTLYNSMGSVVYKGYQHNPVSLPVSVGGLYFYKVQAAGKSGSGAVVVTE